MDKLVDRPIYQPGAPATAAPLSALPSASLRTPGPSKVRVMGPGRLSLDAVNKAIAEFDEPADAFLRVRIRAGDALCT